MYLRRIRLKDGYRYQVRESREADGAWECRDLLDLGENPGACIEYAGGNGFYFKPEIEEALDALGVEYSARDLEDLFFPFLPPHIRRIVETYRRKPSAGSQARREDENWEREVRKLHWFDKRRLHYLRFGRIDIGNMDAQPWRFLTPLLRKCRDEIESSFDAMERRLRSHETGSYIYAALNLESRFPGHFLRHNPGALDSEKVDGCFMEEICRLGRDLSFFRGMDAPDGERLHPFIQKYVILYFDGTLQPRNPLGDFIEEVIRRRRMHRHGASPAPSMGVKAALDILCISPEQYQAMARRDLIRIYRRKAKRLHPDKGGEHEAFLCLTQAYELLLSMK